MKRRTVQVEALGGIISDNATSHNHRGTHKFIPWGTLVAMVVRFAALRSVVGSGLVGVVIRPTTADGCHVRLGCRPRLRRCRVESIKSRGPSLYSRSIDQGDEVVTRRVLRTGPKRWIGTSPGQLWRARSRWTHVTSTEAESKALFNHFSPIWSPSVFAPLVNLFRERVLRLAKQQHSFTFSSNAPAH